MVRALHTHLHDAESVRLNECQHLLRVVVGHQEVHAGGRERREERSVFDLVVDVETPAMLRASSGVGRVREYDGRAAGVLLQQALPVRGAPAAVDGCS